jgi:hypothetical protein
MSVDDDALVGAPLEGVVALGLMAGSVLQDETPTTTTTAKSLVVRMFVAF